MGDFRFKRNGVVIDEPRNWNELEVSYDFFNRTESASINISALEFAGEEAINIRQRILNGLTGGIGIFEGDPFEVEVGEASNPVFDFKGYLDYADSPEFIGCDGVKVALKKRHGVDWLNDVADGFSFRYLFDKGVITSGDFIRVPYVINYVPDTMQLIVLGMSLFMMTKELIQAIKSTAEAVADLVDAGVPVVGTSVGLGAGVVTAWDIGNFILSALKVVAYIAYVIAIIIAIKNLIEELIEQLCPKKRYHLGMSIYTMAERACQHLGLGFSSTLLSKRKNWVVIPSKGHKGGMKPEGWKGAWVEKGVPNPNEGMDTFGDWIRFWKEAFCADWRIVNGVFQFEREDFWDSVGTYEMPDVFTNQATLKDQIKPNTDEIISNYNINWAYDVQDQNTLDNQEGRIFQVITEPNIKVNVDLVNIKRLEEIGIGCSLPLRKDELTKIEEVLKKLAKFVDKVTGFFGSGTSYEAKILGRLGSLLLSSHFITVPKIVAMSGDKLANNQREIFDAKVLWDELHYIRSFVEVNGIHNQWFRFDNVKVPFCWEDFLTLMENNTCLDVNGEENKIENFKWKVWEDFATIDFRVRRKYTNNLKLTYVKP